jgi:hypothetical protein
MELLGLLHLLKVAKWEHLWQGVIEFLELLQEVIGFLWQGVIEFLELWKGVIEFLVREHLEL